MKSNLIHKKVSTFLLMFIISSAITFKVSAFYISESPARKGRPVDIRSEIINQSFTHRTDKPCALNQPSINAVLELL
jgi:hypothetical protein